MRSTIGLAYVLAVFAFIGVVVTALARWLTGATTPLWEGFLLGTVLGIGTIVVLYLRKRGSIELWRTARFFSWQQRKRQAAEERDQIMADALVRKEAQGE